MPVTYYTEKEVHEAVRRACMAAAEEEREACAQLAEKHAADDGGEVRIARRIADNIRSRTEVED